jgi:histidinol-phosphatase
MDAGADPLDTAVLHHELALAHELADAANDIALALFRSTDLRVDRKADRSEVTEADRRAESAIAEMVLAQRPDHGLLGEEHGLVGDPSSPWRWIIDPIDGTSNFVRHVPVWATLVALTHAVHGPVLGVVAAPALGRRWAAARGLGATADGRPISVSTVERLDEAQVSITFSSGWEELGRTDALVDLLMCAQRTRGFGDFWQHMLVAEGAIDLAVDAVGLQPYDIAALQVIVEEAGGVITDRNGERRIDTGTAVSSNGRLHDEAVSRLRD